MAEYTTNYNLIKPAQTDFFNVDDLNDNADKIDTALKTNADGVSAANAAIAQNTSDISANTAAIAQNTSDIAANTSAIGSNTTAIGQNTTAIGQRVKYSDALTMEEIEAATSLTDKVAAAAAAKSLKDALTNLGTYKRKSYSYTYSLAAGASLSITDANFGYTPISGYEPIAYEYVNASSTSNEVLIKYFSLPNYSSTMLTIKNVMNGAVNNSTATVAILFAPVSITNA